MQVFKVNTVVNKLHTVKQNQMFGGERYPPVSGKDRKLSQVSKNMIPNKQKLLLRC